MKARLASKSKIFGGLGVLASVAFVGAVTAFACVPGAKITPGPTSGSPGTKITVTGATFDPAGSPVKVYWDGTRGTLMGTVAVQADRSFTISFDVPATATGGTHIISATQLDAAGRAYNPVNATFAVAGTRPANASNVQGAAQQQPQPDGAGAPVIGTAPARAPANASAAPAATSNAAPAASGARSAAPATSNSPAAAATANQPVTGPASTPATEAAVAPFKAPTPTPESAAVADQPAENRAPAWLLVPLGLMALGFLGAGTGIFLADRKRVRVEAR